MLDTTRTTLDNIIGVRMNDREFLLGVELGILLCSSIQSNAHMIILDTSPRTGSADKLLGIINGEQDECKAKIEAISNSISEKMCEDLQARNAVNKAAEQDLGENHANIGNNDIPF